MTILNFSNVKFSKIITKYTIFLLIIVTIYKNIITSKR
jgi:hypothetical protein